MRRSAAQLAVQGKGPGKATPLLSAQSSLAQWLV